MPRGKAGGSPHAPKTPDGPIRLSERPLIQSPVPKGPGTPVPIDEIAPNPRNLRGSDLGTDEEREEMVVSLRTVGLIQALVVGEIGEFLKLYPQYEEHFTPDVRYVVITGHRRLDAAQVAGMEELRVDVQNNLLPVLDEVFLDENDKRRNLTPFQEGEGYRRLREEMGYSYQEIADRRGRSKSHIVKRIKLLTLDDAARRLILDKVMGVDTAVNLLNALDDAPSLVVPAFEVMQDKGLNAKEAAQHLILVRSGKAAEPAEVLPEPPAPVPAQRPSPNGSPVLTEPSGAKNRDADDTDPDRIRAAAERDRHCRYLIAEYAPADPDPHTIRIAATTLAQASKPTLQLAHRWMSGTDAPGVESLDAASFTVSVSAQGDATLLLRLAYAVALADVELRAADRRRKWDARTVAHVRHLVEAAGYRPTPWEQRHISQSATPTQPAR